MGTLSLRYLWAFYKKKASQRLLRSCENHPVIHNFTEISTGFAHIVWFYILCIFSGFIGENPGFMYARPFNHYLWSGFCYSWWTKSRALELTPSRWVLHDSSVLVNVRFMKRKLYILEVLSYWIVAKVYLLDNNVYL